MGTACSSLKKKDRQRSASDEGQQAEVNKQRKNSGRSVDSLPYGRGSPPTPAKSSHNEPSSLSQPNGETKTSEPPTIITPNAKEDSNFLGLMSTGISPCASPSPCPSSQSPTPYTTPSPTKLQPSTSPTGHQDLSHSSVEEVSASPLSPQELDIKLSSYTKLFSIRDDNCHVVAISTESNEVSVWNVHREQVVRTLKGVNQPRDVKMIDGHRALVLCNRELKVYNLDTGTLETKLKGVMNQKMPYFGLHDENYVVALSRNRMYVNLMNLTTGDLVTTFKVGEDRFLNSLLVSANGKICVCGDETQKPFPLLVWDLMNRKLLYDLRIPNHEFITKLSAISDDGHYVVSVCKELNTSATNFIIVYDLQSGTLFNKWKPESNSCSVAITSQTDCVINGVESCCVLVWDLSTGTKKYSLTGHTAPPDVLQSTDDGTMFLSYDSTGKDRSVRIWSIETGACINVFTPDQEISCCCLSPGGRFVCCGFVSSKKLYTWWLSEKEADEAKTSQTQYGDESRDGQEFDVGKN